MNDCDVVKLSKCFWCGGEKNELILLGDRARASDRKKWCDNKSMGVVTNYEPCDKCKEAFAKGIQLIEAQDDPMNPDQPAIIEGVYPTGRYWVVKKGVLGNLPEDQTTMFIKEKDAREIGLYNLEDKDDANNS